MWVVLLIPVVFFVLSLAVRPIRTLIITARIILFLYAVGFWIVGVVSVNDGAALEWYFWLLPSVLTILWLLTFIKRRQRVNVRVEKR